MKEVYERAEQFLPAQASKLVRNLTIEPVWIDGTDRFIYQRQLPNQGKEFVLVDPERNTTQPAFDHARLAAALATPQGGKAYTATTLPFERVTLSEKNGALEFTLGGKPWRCALADYKCGPGVEKEPGELPSPDGKWMAFVRDHNLWVRSVSDGRERALTTDGEEAYSYGTAFTGIDLISVRRFNRKIQAKDYDLLVMPNRNHAFVRDPYFHRRRWDYLVKHLLGAEPPVGFQIKAVIPEPQR